MKKQTSKNRCLFYPANIYLFKVNNKNTRKRCEISSKLTIKPPERCQWRRSGDFIVNFEHVSQLYSLPIVDFEPVIVSQLEYLNQLVSAKVPFLYPLKTGN